MNDDLVNMIYDFINPARYHHIKLMKELIYYHEKSCYECGLIFDQFKNFVFVCYICKHCNKIFCPKCYVHNHYKKNKNGREYIMKYIINDHNENFLNV